MKATPRWEGYSRKGDKELSHFINISLGSLSETKYLLYFLHRLGYLKDDNYDNHRKTYDKLGKLLWKFYEAICGKQGFAASQSAAQLSSFWASSFPASKLSL